MNESSRQAPHGAGQGKQTSDLQSEVPDVMETISLIALARLIWRDKWHVAVITTVFAVASIGYALFATEYYEAEVLVLPTNDESMQNLASQFGGLASLAGIDLSSGGTAEPIAVLRSREFAREFIDDLNLLPVLFADAWDEKRERWLTENPKDQPDMRDAIKRFREDILSVREDTKSGLVTVGVEWTSPELAAVWANLLVDRVNSRMRKRALQDAEKNVNYLQTELKDVSVVAIQQSIGRLLESELQKLMLAKGNEEFSFRVIDPASMPKYRSRPKRTLLVITSAFLGCMVGVLVVIVRRSWQ